jgi:hypothetical protein
LRVDGGDNQIVRQACLNQFDDGVIVKRMLGKGQGADCQQYDRENVFTHETSPCGLEPRNCQITAMESSTQTPPVRK